MTAFRFDLMKSDREENFVEGEPLPKYGLIVHGTHEPKMYTNLEEAKKARDLKQHQRPDKKIEIYTGHGTVVK